MGASDFFKGAADELVRTVQHRDPQDRRQAQQIPVAVIAAWERAVSAHGERVAGRLDGKVDYLTRPYRAQQ